MKTKVVLLSEHGTRFPLMMAEGLLARPDVEPVFSRAFQVLGRPLTRALSDEQLLAAMDDAEVIFLCARKHYPQPHIIKAIDQRRLWPKVVVYDFQDSPHIERRWRQRARAYFKRSFPIGVKRRPRRQWLGKPIFPLDFGVLHCYPEVFDQFDAPRDIDVGYYFQIQSLVKKKQIAAPRSHTPVPASGRLDRLQHPHWAGDGRCHSGSSQRLRPSRGKPMGGVHGPPETDQGPLHRLSRPLGRRHAHVGSHQ